MFGDGYVGSSEDALKIARYNKKRDKEKLEFEVSGDLVGQIAREAAHGHVQVIHVLLNARERDTLSAAPF